MQSKESDRKGKMENPEINTSVLCDAINKATTRNEVLKGTDTFRSESSDEVMQAWDKVFAETDAHPFPIYLNSISPAR